MAKVFIKSIEEHVDLFRDPRTGIAWVENGKTGGAHSAHPNICASGSTAGMRQLGHWGRQDIAVRSHGLIYNVSKCCVTDALDEIARRHCQCGGNHGEGS